MTRKPGRKVGAGRSKAAACFVGLIVSLAVTLTLPGRTSAGDRGQLAPAAWTPSLEGVREQLEDEAEAREPKSQRLLNRTGQSMAELRDAQLFIAYVLLLQTLNAKERADLFHEQERWLRTRETAAAAAVRSRGGSLEPLEYSGAFRKVTEARLAELEGRLTRRRTATGGSRAREEKQP